MRSLYILSLLLLFLLCFVVAQDSNNGNTPPPEQNPGNSTTDPTPPTSNPTNTTQPTPEAPKDNGDESFTPSGLPTGAVIGVIVGAVLVAAILALSAYWLVFAGRWKKKSEEDDWGFNRRKKSKSKKPNIVQAELSNIRPSKPPPRVSMLKKESTVEGSVALEAEYNLSEKADKSERWREKSPIHAPAIETNQDPTNDELSVHKWPQIGTLAEQRDNKTADGNDSKSKNEHQERESKYLDPGERNERRKSRSDRHSRSKRDDDDSKAGEEDAVHRRRSRRSYIDDEERAERRRSRRENREEHRHSRTEEERAERRKSRRENREEQGQSKTEEEGVERRRSRHSRIDGEERAERRKSRRENREEQGHSKTEEEGVERRRSRHSRIDDEERAERRKSRRENREEQGHSRTEEEGVERRRSRHSRIDDGERAERRKSRRHRTSKIEEEPEGSASQEKQTGKDSQDPDQGVKTAADSNLTDIKSVSSEKVNIYVPEESNKGELELVGASHFSEPTAVTPGQSPQSAQPIFSDGQLDKSSSAAVPRKFASFTHDPPSNAPEQQGSITPSFSRRNSKTPSPNGSQEATSPISEAARKAEARTTFGPSRQISWKPAGARLSRTALGDRSRTSVIGSRTSLRSKKSSEWLQKIEGKSKDVDIDDVFEEALKAPIYRTGATVLVSAAESSPRIGSEDEASAEEAVKTTSEELRKFRQFNKK